MIKDKLTAIKNLIAAYEIKYGRDRGSVALLAASKKQTAENIRTAYLGGQRLFGESYLQEALPKMAALADCDIEWHFIGPIQSNKTKKIAEHFSWVESVDSIKIAERLNHQRPLHLPPLNICLEINLNAETTKSGVAPSEITELALACQNFTRLKLRGLMSIPAPTHSLETARRNFHLLHEIWESLKTKGLDLDTLSMGMSDDFEAAIAEGSTLVRIGTAIFDKRS